MNARKLISSLALIVLVPGVGFGAEVGELLRRAEVADRYVSYRGVKTATIALGCYCANARLKVIHLKPDKTRTQYFAPTLLAGVIVIQDGIDSWKYHPKEDVWEPIHVVCVQPVDLIRQEALENYDVRVVGTEQVAGRQAYVVQALPRNPGEHARRIWIDREHYLVIGTQVENVYGSVVNSSRYTNVDFNPGDISPSLFKVSGRLRQVQQRTCPVGFKVLKPSYLPSGYRLVGVSCLTVNGCSSAHLQFSNGVNIISLFQHRADRVIPPSRVDSKVTNVMTWARNGIQFTLMGDVARAQLQKIANSTQ